MKLGEFIKEKRILKGYSLKQVSDLLGVSQTYIRDIEKGNRNISDLTKLNKLADTLNIKDNEYFELMNLVGFQGNDVPPDIKLKLTNATEELYNKVRNMLYNNNDV